MFLVGLFSLAFGAACVIQSNLGVASWDVLHIGMSHLTSLSIGVWVQIIGIVMVLLACVLEKKRPKIGSLINIILLGFYLNWILAIHLIPAVPSIFGKTALLVLGITFMGFGSGMYVASKIGAGPRDGLTLALAEKTGRSIRLIRTSLEITALLLGWLAGGPIGLGTFISVLLIGPIMQGSLQFWNKRIDNFGAEPIELVTEEL